MQTHQFTTVLTRSQVQQCLTYEDAMLANKNLFISDLNKHLIPMRTVMEISNHGPTLFMPCYLKMSSHDDDQHHLGLKIVSVRSNNPVKYSLDSVNGTISLLNHENGSLICLMHANDITGVRTACGSALAVEKLLNSYSGFSSTVERIYENLGIMGCGTQGKCHMFAMLRIAKNVKRVILWNQTEERGRNLVRELVENFKASEDLPFKFVASESSQPLEDSHSTRIIEISFNSNANQVSNQSDIICCCTNSSKPFFETNQVRDGTIITCIGSYKPFMQEVESQLVTKSKVIADLKEAVLEESGDLIIPLQENLISHDHIQCELSQLIQFTSEQVNEKFQIGKDIIIYKSVGFAAQDLAVAHQIYQRALSLKVGLSINLNE
ncbi:predicted protein [Naegleria gruberi]|uniref:Predicted protein n=1 Tax=Naegleria gruberi TaxID=5762 RepID=D2VN89_NAEGR|nr:uncharacterized protein NAEGRDRAFT_70410 [Naegleria gruberi]EFC41609.1 predicted protein [Naegleria gruberi]|eukprot:XP_002674353.1 predicted protein [Naegleria gruberi strain NEG-M]